MSEQINSIIPWLGGKRQLRSKISEYIPEQDVSLKNRKLKYYVEVFGGAAWLMLYKEKWAETEVYNDLNKELTTLFRVLKFHKDEFLKQFDYSLNSKEDFEYYLTNEVQTDIQKAVAAYYKYACSFSAKGGSFAIKNKKRETLEDTIEKVSKRFQNICVTNYSYIDLFKRFDRENVFLYLDPPYYGKEDLYQVKFETEDHGRLADLLKDFKGKFALSYNDCTEIREMYHDFRMAELEVKYSCFDKKNETAKELLIMNY